MLKTFVCEAVKTFGYVSKGSKSPKLQGEVFTLMAKLNGGQEALLITTHETPSERRDLAQVTVTLPAPFADKLLDRLEELQHWMADQCMSEEDIDSVRANQEQWKYILEKGNLTWNNEHIRARLGAGETIPGFALHRGSHLEVK